MGGHGQNDGEESREGEKERAFLLAPISVWFRSLLLFPYDWFY
jgi:hypothetical protein